MKWWAAGCASPSRKLRTLPPWPRRRGRRSGWSCRRVFGRRSTRSPLLPAEMEPFDCIPQWHNGFNLIAYAHNLLFNGWKSTANHISYNFVRLRLSHHQLNCQSYPKISLYRQNTSSKLKHNFHAASYTLHLTSRKPSRCQRPLNGESKLARKSTDPSSSAPPWCTISHQAGSTSWRYPCRPPREESAEGRTGRNWAQTPSSCPRPPPWRTRAAWPPCDRIWKRRNRARHERSYRDGRCCSESSRTTKK